jgi:ribosomal protein L37AE/L43A
MPLVLSVISRSHFFPRLLHRVPSRSLVCWRQRLPLTEGVRKQHPQLTLKEKYMPRGYKCPNCGAMQGKYENGQYVCGNKSCGSIWWGPFDKPSAGEPRKGYKCHQCEKQTVHPVGTLKDIAIWRCSTCGATQLEPINPAL